VGERSNFTFGGQVIHSKSQPSAYGR